MNDECARGHCWGVSSRSLSLPPFSQKGGGCLANHLQTVGTVPLPGRAWKANLCSRHHIKALLVIAHPDDEAMFFGPLLRTMYCMLVLYAYTVRVCCMPTLHACDACCTVRVDGRFTAAVCLTQCCLFPSLTTTRSHARTRARTYTHAHIGLARLFLFAFTFRKETHSVHVLCLCTGNYDGLGNIRVPELHASCKVLVRPLTASYPACTMLCLHYAMPAPCSACTVHFDRTVLCPYAHL